jgi:hypothetical protein
MSRAQRHPYLVALVCIAERRIHIAVGGIEQWLAHGALYVIRGISLWVSEILSILFASAEPSW